MPQVQWDPIAVAHAALPYVKAAVFAFAILVVGRWVAKLLVAGMKRVLERGKVEPALVKFLCSLTYAVILVLVVISALGQVGVNTTSFAAVIAAGGLAIGLALQGSLSNFASGVMLILFHHFRHGDLIEAGGQKGYVEDLQIFWTVLRAEDGTKIVVPNGAITGGVIKVLKPAATATGANEAKVAAAGR